MTTHLSIHSDPSQLRMYSDLARYWPLLSPVGGYAEEAAIFREVLLQSTQFRPETLLELGSGGGHNAFHLKNTFDITLVELSAGMLACSQAINPELEHQSGDMRTIRLGRTFDAVFIHDAICYMTTREDLQSAVDTAFAHCAPGGVALFAPDYTLERFTPGTSRGGSDHEQGGFRYLEWTWDPDPTDDTVLTDYAFLIRDETGGVRVVHDRHVEGLFSKQIWIDVLNTAGFQPRVEIAPHSDLEEGYELFLGIRPK